MRSTAASPVFRSKKVSGLQTTDSLEIALSIVRFGGTIVLVGLLEMVLTFHAEAVVLKHVSLLGSMGGTLKELKACLDLIADGVLRPRVEVDKFKDFPQVLDRLHNGQIKSRVVLVPDRIDPTVVTKPL